MYLTAWVVLVNNRHIHTSCSTSKFTHTVHSAYPLPIFTQIIYCCPDLKAKIEKNENAGSCQESNPKHPCLYIRALDSLVSFTNACRHILHSFWICMPVLVLILFSCIFIWHLYLCKTRLKISYWSWGDHLLNLSIYLSTWHTLFKLSLLHEVYANELCMQVWVKLYPTMRNNKTWSTSML